LIIALTTCLEAALGLGGLWVCCRVSPTKSHGTNHSQMLAFPILLSFFPLPRFSAICHPGLGRYSAMPFDAVSFLLAKCLAWKSFHRQTTATRFDYAGAQVQLWHVSGHRALWDKHHLDLDQNVVCQLQRPVWKRRSLFYRANLSASS
jgi:hypothetical protein